MPVSKAQQKSVAKYMKSNYDELKVRVEKGKREKLQAHAATKSESLNGFVKRAIDETMERDMVLANATKDDKETLQAHATTKGESLSDFVDRAISETLARDKVSEAQLAGVNPETKNSAERGTRLPIGELDKVCIQPDQQARRIILSKL